MGGAYEILDKGNNGLIIENDFLEESVEKIFSYLGNKKQQNKNVEKAFDYASIKFKYETFKKNILDTIE